LIGDFPTDKLDREFIDNKLKRDQEKLLRIVEYVKHDDGDRADFFNSYFGVSD